MIKPTRNTSLGERCNISKLAIAYPWLTLGFWLAVTVAGIIAFSSLKYALFPEITFPVVVVQAKAPILTALETEAQLTQPLEQSLASLKGLDKVRSSTLRSSKRSYVVHLWLRQCLRL
jgi:multidrug efflux pump subunit AcrB